MTVVELVTELSVLKDHVHSPGLLKLFRRYAYIIAVLVCFGAAAMAAWTWRNRILPAGVVVHHSALIAEAIAEFGNDIDASTLDRIHSRRGFGIFYAGRLYHIGYHYVILPDGTVQTGRPERCRGAHTLGYNDHVGICLIGNFSNESNRQGELGPQSPTPAQIRAVISLTNALRGKYGFGCRSILLHREINPTTVCPGEQFIGDEFRRGLGCTP